MILTVVPPLVVPDVGVSEVTVGVGADEGVFVGCPRCACPAGRGDLDLHGARHVGFGLGVDDVGLVTVKDVAAVAPKWTAVAPMNPVPVILTVVPPLVVPDVGVSEVTVGVGAVNVNSWPVPDVAVPPAVVTWTLTAPATWALVLAWTIVGLVTVKLVAVVAPKWTAVAPNRSCR